MSENVSLQDIRDVFEVQMMMEIHMKSTGIRMHLLKYTLIKRILWIYLMILTMMKVAKKWVKAKIIQILI